MAIQVTPSHFTERAQALSEIEADGLFVIETEVSQDKLTATPHAHGHFVHIYMLEGLFELHETGTGLTHQLEAGSKTVVPAETFHSEHCPAPFRAVFGVPYDPSTGDGSQAGR